VLILTEGHAAGLPKSAAHVTPVLSPAVVSQVTVFVPDPSVVPLRCMFNGTLAVPHTVAEQVKVAVASSVVADEGLTAQVGALIAKHHILYIVTNLITPRTLFSPTHLLNLVQSEIASFDPLTPKTPP